jgi:hypothetical protein
MCASWHAQVLSSPAVLLTRLTAAREALLQSPAFRNGALYVHVPNLAMLDPAAGDGNYTEHLPDGLGEVPALALVSKLGWEAVLLEPLPPAYAWLKVSRD